MTAMPRTARHALALGFFAALTIAWLWPVLASPATRIPGEGAGDNFLFVWNLWWTRQAILSHAWPLWCPALFVPFGVDLTLDTLTLLPTVIVALLSPHGSVLAGTNAIIAAHLFLNFAIAYALAYRLTKATGPALIAALLFGWSPYVEVRLLGHFNLIAAWTLALTGLLAVKVHDKPSTAAAVGLGLAIGAIGYLEYYYVVYAAALVAVLAGAHVLQISHRTGIQTRGQRRVLASLGVLIALASVLAAVIKLSGGFVLNVGATVVSMKSAHNPAAAAGLLALAAVLVAVVPRSSVDIDWIALRQTARTTGTAAAVAAVCLLPLIASGAHLWLRGEYVSQRYLWRSAPAGVDVGTLLLGNPRGLIWRGLPVAAYRHLGIDEIEQTAWLSPGMLALCAVALRRRRESPAGRPWIAVAIIFGMWAVGPYLVAFGRSLPIILPATLVRFIPVVSNARVPGRTIVLVYLAGSMLAACGFQLLRQSGQRRLAFVLAGLAIADLAPARPPVLTVDRPSIYDTLRARPEPGAVCEVPLGIRDSFGVTGLFDPWSLWHQTIHERAMAGGFVSRLAPRIRLGYLDAPVLGSLLRLSAGGSLDAEPVIAPSVAVDALKSDGFRFVVLDRNAAAPGLVEYVRRLGLSRIGDDGRRELFVVERADLPANHSPAR
jgi:hypothetical protein